MALSERAADRKQRVMHFSHSVRSSRRPESGSDSSPARVGSIWADFLFSFAVLAFFFWAFYYRLPLGEDQGIYHYMAWGLTHGMTPYRDTINMNWPGTIVVHLMARAISGANAWGLRLLDVIFLLGLSTVTSYTLARFRVGRAFRLTCLTSYYLAYFLHDYPQTAQRESFALPLTVVGFACCLSYLRDAAVSRRAALVCGLVSGLGLTIKPTLGLPLAFLMGLPLIWPPAGRREALGFTAWFVAGLLAAGGLMGVFLVAFCSPTGFIEWGVKYAFGPYSGLNWPWPLRFQHAAQWLLPMGYNSAPAVLAAGGLCALGSAVVARGGRAVRAGGWKAPLPFVGLSLLVFASILAQGKTHCIYHYNPMFWALAVTGAVALQAATSRRAARALSRLAVPICLALLILIGVDIRWATQNLIRPDAEELARQLRFQVGKRDEFVMFGFSTTFMSKIARKTPFPYVDSWIILVCSSEATKDHYEDEIGGALARSVANPKVKCYAVELNLAYFRQGRIVTSHDLAEKYVPGPVLASLGYQYARMKMPGGHEYDVWTRQ